MVELSACNAFDSLPNLQITDEDIDDIMVSALEGGINYWCENAIVVGDYLGEFASDQISRGGELKLCTFEDGDYLLTKESFIKGLKKYLTSNMGKAALEQKGNQTIVVVGMIDANAADSIIQYALFDELIYA